MPFGFLFGKRRQTEVSNDVATDEPKVTENDEVLTEVDSTAEYEYIEEFNGDKVCFMNPSFTARPSSRQSFNRTAELGVHVHMSPSAFAFQTLPTDPNRWSFPSRDDSEIETRTAVDWESFDGENSISSCMRSPYINAMFLNRWSDDSDVASSTAERYPLRHIGSAMSYRLSVSETMESVKNGEYKRHSSKRFEGDSLPFDDMEEIVDDVRDRYKMKRLESIVGRVHKSDASLHEFGVIDSSHFIADSTQGKQLVLEPPPTTTQSAESASIKHQPAQSAIDNTIKKDSNDRVVSYPLVFNDIEEENDIYESETETFVGYDHQESIQKAVAPDTSAKSDTGLQSSYKVLVEPLMITDTSEITNPLFGNDDETVTENLSGTGKPAMRLKLVKQKKKGKERRMKLPGKDYRNEADDGPLRAALMERYLIQSVVDKYVIGPNNVPID